MRCPDAAGAETHICYNRPKMRLATLVSINRYPVKALRGESLARAEIAPDGIPGDRTRALIVTSEGHARSGQTYRGKENARLHLVAGAGAGLAEAEAAGLAARIGAESGRYFDVHPISLVLDSWLAELAALAGLPDVEALRFRPNLVAVATAGFRGTERDLAGRRLRVGSALLHVVAPIVRCVTPSYDLVTGAAGRELARALAGPRGNIMGVYCTVVRPGPIASGDLIETVEPAEPAEPG